MYLLHKECSRAFGTLPSRCHTAGSFWREASAAIRTLPVEEVSADSKEDWKVLIKENDPKHLKHAQVFILLKVIVKLVYNEHVRWWSWCLLLQVPELVTADELAQMRAFARSTGDEVWVEVLADCFGQADLRDSAQTGASAEHIRTRPAADRYERYPKRSRSELSNGD